MKFKKFLLSFLASLVLIFSIAPNFLVAKAQDSTWYNSSPKDFYNKVYDTSNGSEIFGERYTAAQVQWVVYSLAFFIINLGMGNTAKGQELASCFLLNNGDLTACQSLLSEMGPNIDTATIKTEKQSLISLVFADRPLSGVSYVREKINNFRLIPEAKAQAVGFGFKALEPVQNMWRATRNVAFGLFVLISVIFAFMIMFRVKINPQTVVTVQSAIPKVITALILVTFSYAIAGFLIDLMYVFIGIFSVIGSSMFQLGPQNAQIGIDPSGVFSFLTKGQPLGVNIQIGVVGLLAIYLICFTFAFIALLMVNLGIIGTALSGGLLAILGAASLNITVIIGLIVIVIGIIIVLWNVIKTFWALLKAFVNVILLTILAPLQISLGVLIPNFGFGAWVRSYISALSTFVVTGVLILMSFIFLAQGINIGIGSIFTGGFFNVMVKLLVGQSPMNPFTGNSNAWPPLLGSGSGAMTGLLMLGASFVLFTMIPKATEVVASFLSGKPFAYGSAIGEAIGPVRWGANKAWEYSGGKDVWELGNLARRARIINENFGENGRFRGVAEKYVGGRSASDILSNLINNYTKKSGRGEIE